MSAAARKRAPSTASVGLRHKLAWDLALVRKYVEEALSPPDVAALLADVEQYDEVSRTHGDRGLSAARVLEIGYGYRPYRLMALQSMGVDALGVDTEVPIMRGGLREFRDAYRRNGAERVAKSAVRHLLFDRRQRRSLAAELRERGHAPRVQTDRFLVGDATELDLPSGSVDLIVSEDVFEHIPAAALPDLVDRMSRWLAPAGLALVRPNVFTGIMGGHVIEWNARSFRRPRRRRTQPWAHLRGSRPPVNTYLNELTRAEYRRLFATHFQIVDERPRDPDLGREHLTPDVRAELAGYADEELFSNQVLFVLRPLPAREER